MSIDYFSGTQEGGEVLVEIARQENTLDHVGDLIVVLEVPNPYDVGYSPNDYVGIDFHLVEKQVLLAGCENLKPQPGQTPSTTEYRFRVSSRHLCLASAYFRNLLEGPSPSITGTAQQPAIVRIPEVKNATAFLLLMKICHGFIDQIPQEIPAGILGDIALMTAYFQCTGTVEAFAMTWLEQAVKKQLDLEHWKDQRGGYQYFLAGCVFRHPLAFGVGANKAVRQSRGPLKSITPFIPEFIINCINAWREETMDKIQETMEHLCREKNRALSEVERRGRDGPLPIFFYSPWQSDLWEWKPLQEPREEVSLNRYFELAEEVLDKANDTRERAVGSLVFGGLPEEGEKVMDLINSAETVLKCLEQFIFPLPEPEMW